MSRIPMVFQTPAAQQASAGASCNVSCQWPLRVKGSESGKDRIISRPASTGVQKEIGQELKEIRRRFLGRPERQPIDGAPLTLARRGVLPGSAGPRRARLWPPVRSVDLRADGDRRRADADVRYQPGSSRCIAPEHHRSIERAQPMGRHDVGGHDLGNHQQLAGTHPRRGVCPRIVPCHSNHQGHRNR